MSEFKTPLITAGLIGTVAAGCYLSYCMLMKSEDELSGAELKEQTLTQVYTQLKKELQTYNIDLPKDSNGLIDKNFFVKLHTLIYKFKKYGQEMLTEANFRERIEFLEE